MHVLLTRPQAASDALARRLRGLGHAVCISPVLDFAVREPLPLHPPGDVLLATSASAFEVLPDDAATGAWSTMPLYCVGARTGEAALAHGFAGPAHFAADGAGLLEVMKTGLAAGANITYLAGKDRKPSLENGLAAAGFSVHAIVLYEAITAAALQPHAVQALARGSIDVVLHFSRRSAETFVRLARAAGLAGEAAACRHVCISRDTAEGLQGLPSAPAGIAATPDTRGVLDCLNMIAN